MSDSVIGEYRGFAMSFVLDTVSMNVSLILTGATTHSVDLSDSPTGNISRIDNAIDAIQDRLKMGKRKLADLHAQVTAAEEELKREFPRAKELREKAARLAQLNAELTLQERKPAPPEEGNNPDSKAVLQPVPDVASKYEETVNF